MASPLLTLTYDQTKADLLELAANDPDRTIDDMGGYCVYFATEDAGIGSYSDLLPGQGCCIVGRVLEKHGLTVEDVRTVNAGVNVVDLHEKGIIATDEKRTLLLLQNAQSAQDSGDTWRDAVDSAIDEAEHG